MRYMLGEKREPIDSAHFSHTNVLQRRKDVYDKPPQIYGTAETALPIVADAHNLPFAANTFELVYGSFIDNLDFEGVKWSFRPFLCEAYHVMKVGGNLVFSLPDIAYYTARNKEFGVNFGFMPLGGAIIPSFCYAPEQLHHILAYFGFEIKKVRRIRGRSAVLYMDSYRRKAIIRPTRYIKQAAETLNKKVEDMYIVTVMWARKISSPKTMNCKECNRSAKTQPEVRGIRRCYNSVAPSYTDPVEHSTIAYKNALEEPIIVELLARAIEKYHKPITALEACAGTGRISVLIGALLPEGSRLVIFDFSPAMSKRLQIMLESESVTVI